MLAVAELMKANAHSNAFLELIEDFVKQIGILALTDTEIK